MFCLSSSVRTSNLSGLGNLLTLVALLAAAGCSPDSPPKPSASDAGARRTNDSTSSALAEHSAARSPSDSDVEAPQRTTPHDPIPVDSEGYVTLGATTSQEQAVADTAPAVSPAPALPEIAPAQVEKRAPVENAALELSASPADKTAALSIEPQPASPRPAAESADPTAAPAEEAKPEAEQAQQPKSKSVKAEVANVEVARSEELKPAAAIPARDKADAVKPNAESGLATYDEKHQEIAKDWPKPQALLFLTGQQHGYIEPCGCTGLENQKGGLNRRDSLLKQLSERGWDVVPMDVGNFERRVGRQAEIKFQTTVEALKDMRYRAATLGVDDLKLSSTHLLSLTATEGKTETPFISSNAYILVEEYMPKSKIIEVGGRKIGVTAVLGDSFRTELTSNGDITTTPAAQSLKPVLAELKNAKCDYFVLLAHATLEESQQLARDVPGFDLVVTSGGYPEPFYQLEAITDSQSKLAQVGAKGMYTVLIGLYPESDQPVRYQRVALSSQFPDSPRMLERFGNYQKQLQSLGFDGLGLRPSTLPEGRKFVGSETCGECHTKAFEVWKSSKHFGSTESLVHPPNDRSMIPRHFDPECVSCHVTGWNAKSYFPYASGYTSLEETPMLTGSGCENCHGAGSKHVAAENGDIEADDELLSQLRAQMRLPLAEAKTRCLDCHDQDNSPDFQHEGAFEKYWEQIAHPGKD